MSAPDAPLTTRDVIRLYGAFNRQLMRIVRAIAGGPSPVIEDACQVAWTALVCPGQPVEQGSARAWLIRTAVREALRLKRLEAREASLDQVLREQRDHVRSEADDEPAELACRRERLHTVRLLSARQQRLVWLRALGFNYGEMASYESVSNRTIRRQLERAQHRLRGIDDSGQLDRAAA